MDDLVERLREHKSGLGHCTCMDCYGVVMDDAADEIERLRMAMRRMMMGGNHIVTHWKANWPPYPLNGLTRDQQCEWALRVLGATVDYDLWCCWSEIMQARDSLTEAIPHPDAEHELQARDVL